MSDVNKQLLDALKQMVQVAKRHRPWSASVHQAEKTIAAAEQAQQAEPVARDVLMKFGEEVYDKTFWACRDGDGSINLQAIVDRYAAQPPAVPVPDGYTLVPIEPTQAMLDAGQKEWFESAGADPSFDMYRAMLSVAQKGGK